METKKHLVKPPKVPVEGKKGYALALGGGGTRGSYEIGVWEYLREIELPIRSIAGTSIGSVNGAMMVQKDFEQAKEAWLSIDISLILESIERQEKKRSEKQDLSFFANLGGDLPALSRHIIENGGLDTKPMRNFLSRIIDEEAVRRSDIDYTLTAMDITNFEPKYFHIRDIPQGQLLDYILASCSVPIFKLPEIDGIKYADGGFHDNIPVGPLYQQGFEDIVAVDLSGLGYNRTLHTKGAHLLHIKNSESLGATFQFDLSLVKRNMKLGYLDAKKAFGDLMGHVYYLRHDPPKHPLLYPLQDHEIAYLNDLLALPQNPVLKENKARQNLIKHLSKYSLANQQEVESVDYLQGSLEIAAQQLCVDRVREYTIDELFESVMQAYETLKKNHAKNHTPFEWLKKNLTGKHPQKSLANPFLPDIVENNTWEQSQALAPLLALSLPNYSITALFLMLIINRKKG